MDEDIKEQLFEVRDAFINTIKTFMTTLILTEQTDTLKEFFKYINRFTSSEVIFLIEKAGRSSDIEKIICKIEDDIKDETGQKQQ